MIPHLTWVGSVIIFLKLKQKIGLLNIADVVVEAHRVDQWSIEVTKWNESLVE